MLSTYSMSTEFDAVRLSVTPVNCVFARALRRAMSTKAPASEAMIATRIRTLRDLRVMLDADLADLYGFSYRNKRLGT
jgi:hypothetical protein